MDVVAGRSGWDEWSEQLGDINTTICKIDSQWEFAVCLRKLKPRLSDNLEGWSGWEVGGRLKREGTYVYLWLIHPDVWQRPTQHNIVKQLSFN